MVRRLAPAATPSATVDKLRAAIHAALGTASAKERLAKLGLVPAPTSATELVELQQRELQMWGPVVKASGFSPED